MHKSGLFSYMQVTVIFLLAIFNCMQGGLYGGVYDGNFLCRTFQKPMLLFGIC